MRSISKAERCIEGAKKCSNMAQSYSISMLLAPTQYDYELCERKYRRATKHAYKYIELANYYGGRQ